MTKHLPHVLVLMPVYNGERFLAEQIESILAQTHQALTLVCRDDGSSDQSRAILAQYAARSPQRVRVLEDNLGNLGASGSFSHLMQWALEHAAEFGEAVYVALADQDDIWHLDKIAKGLSAIMSAEAQDSNRLLLVHSDLVVVAADGTPIAPSLMAYQGLDPARRHFSAQLISNTVTGCTSLMNLALLRKSLPVPAEAMMHDWWLSLVATQFGELIFLPEALVDYRQHGRNTLGAKKHSGPAVNFQTLSKLFQRQQSAEAQHLFKRSAQQAQAFLHRFDDELDSATRAKIDQVIELPALGLWRQRWRFRSLRSATSA